MSHDPSQPPAPPTYRRPPAVAGARGRRHVATVAAGAMTLTGLAALLPSSPAQGLTPPKPVIRLVASATPVVDSAGAVWSPDAKFANGGKAWVSTVPIAGTTDDALFQAERYGMKGYTIPLPVAGDYTVTVNAAEVHFTKPKQRVFSIAAEGVKVVSNLDLVLSVGASTAYTTSFTTTVTDGVLDLGFLPFTDQAKVSSISVSSATGDPTVARATTGPTTVTDARGARWTPDSWFADYGKTWTSTTGIAGTEDDVLFQSERYAVRGYTFPVPAKGYYKVTLNASELYWRNAGQRVFDVVAEGTTVLAGIDLIKAVGPTAAYTATFTASVTDGALNLKLPATVDSAKLSSLSVVAVAGPEPTTTPAPTAPASVTSLFGTTLSGDPTSARGGPFGAGSVWRDDIRSAPLADNSAALVANLDRQVKAYYGGVAAFNVWNYTTNIYTVGPLQGRVDLRWDDCQGKGHVPTGIFGTAGQFVSVPMPSNAVPASGTDAALSLYQPSSDTLWSFWKVRKAADGWHACWGGRMDQASTNAGWFGGGFGTTATGLAVEGGLVNIQDVQSGSIDHALSLVVINAASYSDYSWPAQRSDGADPALDAIPEGTRFRLDPSVNVDALNLHPIAKMIAKAAQKHGFIVADKGGAVSVQAEGGTGVQGVTGANPWDTLLAGRPSYAVMANFPWASLQALPKDYGKPADPVVATARKR